MAEPTPAYHAAQLPLPALRVKGFVLQPGFETSGWAFRQPTLDRPLRSDQAGLERLAPGLGTITVAGDEPRFVVVPGERDERGSELFDRIEGFRPQ